MPCECDSVESRGYSTYYDTPEGCDIKTKVMVAARYGIITGLIFGTYDVMMYSHAVGLGNVLRRYAIHVAPLGAMAVTFAAVSNSLVKSRNENDGLNYFLGGAACAPIFAAYYGSKHAFLFGGLALGMIGLLKKTAIDSGHKFFPNYPSHMGLCNSWRNDYSLFTDPKSIAIATCGEKHPVRKDDD